MSTEQVASSIRRSSTDRHTGAQYISGEITVFLSLLLMIMISLLFTVIEGARTNAIMFQTEVSADAALQSVLAEYNRELLEQYDLFFTDIGYGSGESGYILLEQHLQKYMDENLDYGGITLSGMIRDIHRMKADSAVILKACGASDGLGRVLERQAVDYMKDLVNLYDPSQLSSSLEQTLSTGYFGSEDNEEKYQDTLEKLSEFDGKWNPSNQVNKVRNNNSRLMNNVLDGKEISQKGAELSQYISHRERLQRDGFLVGEELPDSLEDLTFQLYMMEKCGKFTQKKDGSYLDYEMEYVLYGNSTDRENLHQVVKRLTVLRNVANFAYIMSDAGKQAQAEALSAACIITILFPELLEVVKYGILAGWSYAESVNDVRILLNGGKVPIIKDSLSWELGLTDAMAMNLHGQGVEVGMDYGDYLQSFLLLMDKDSRNMRFMDIIEMDIRQTPGNGKFALDNCINGFTATLQASSSLGHSYMITRTAGYYK